MRREITDSTLLDVSKLFKVFGDSTRIRILYFLYNKEKSVNQISQSLNMNQSAISHQLKILKNSKLVKCKRNGKEIIYSLDNDRVYNIIIQGLKHINERK